MSDDVMTPMVVPEPPDGLTGRWQGLTGRERLRVAWRMGWVTGHAIVVEKMERVLARGREQGRREAAEAILQAEGLHRGMGDARWLYLDDAVKLAADFLESTGGPE